MFFLLWIPANQLQYQGNPTFFKTRRQLLKYTKSCNLHSSSKKTENLTATINEENRTANRSKYIIYPHEIKNLSRKPKLSIFTTKAFRYHLPLPYLFCSLIIAYQSLTYAFCCFSALFFFSTFHVYLIFNTNVSVCVIFLQMASL